MNRVTIYFFSLLAISLSLTLIGSGCGKKDTPPAADGKPTDNASKPSDGNKAGDGNVVAPVDGKPAIKPGTGTITGIAIFDGTPSGCMPPGKLPETTGCEAPKDKSYQNCEQKWIVLGDNKVVANVVVVLRPPSGETFQAGKRTDELVLDQPFCAFVPHVISIKPGQKLVVKNSAKIVHDTKVHGDGKNQQEAGGVVPIDGKREFTIYPQTKPLTVNCTNHPWMNGIIWAFNHPYSDVTGEAGTFKIENVPTGVKLKVEAWHEGMEGSGFFHSEEFTLEPKEEKKLKLTVKPK